MTQGPRITRTWPHENKDDKGMKWKKREAYAGRVLGGDVWRRPLGCGSFSLLTTMSTLCGKGLQAPNVIVLKFASYVCLPCSGIQYVILSPSLPLYLGSTNLRGPVLLRLRATHSREFSHRIKSVSQANFTPEEVQAQLAGGNLGRLALPPARNTPARHPPARHTPAPPLP